MPNGHFSFWHKVAEALSLLDAGSTGNASRAGNVGMPGVGEHIDRRTATYIHTYVCRHLYTGPRTEYTATLGLRVSVRKSMHWKGRDEKEKRKNTTGKRRGVERLVGFDKTKKN